MEVQELANVLSKKHKDKLGMWYCDLNCYRNPIGFPVALPELADDREKHKNPDFRLAWDAITSLLSEEDMSKAWWTIELCRTEKEWRTWWCEKGAKILGA